MKSSTMEGVVSDQGDPCAEAGEAKDSSSPMAPEQRRGYWASLLERQRASGLTISEFCRSERVSPARFFYWKRRLAPPDGPAPARSSASPAPAAAAALLFSELRLAPSPVGRAGGVEIVSPAGWVVRADAGADAAWVARLVRALEGDGGRAC